MKEESGVEEGEDFKELFGKGAFFPFFFLFLVNE
jgi:hypothetical protein